MQNPSDVYLVEAATALRADLQAAVNRWLHRYGRCGNADLPEGAIHLSIVRLCSMTLAGYAGTLVGRALRLTPPEEHASYDNVYQAAKNDGDGDTVAAIHCACVPPCERN